MGTVGQASCLPLCRQAGVCLVWVINPQNHTVRVYRLDGSSQSLRENDALSGEDVLPGFQRLSGKVSSD
jgi:Uma2 family endonuclease